MKKVLLPAIFLGVVFTIYSCTKERTDNINYYKNHLNTGVDSSGNVLINEFVSNGSNLPNEYGNNSDWIELYNSGDSAVDFSKNNVYITDDSTNPEKFLIDQLSIPAGGYLVVFCDDSARITTQIHTNFGLSKLGEFVGLFRKRSGGGYDTLTWHGFGTVTGSEGRYPNGGNSWTDFPAPTPGASNHL